MQEKSMNELTESAFDKTLNTTEKVKEKLKKIMKENTEALASSDLPEPLHAPDELELEQIRLYMINYKKCHPLATKREIRKAAQQKFKVKIFRKPFKKQSDAV
jgi:hypothetical protein